MLNKKLHILGIRGIPAHHGGFETFAENLSLYLVDKGWEVTVYCQEDTQELNQVKKDVWQGVKRVRIPVKKRSNFTSILFDWKAIRQASKEEGGTYLILGYNTALFASYLRLKGKTVLFNMDGMEWKRSVWPIHGKIWFYLNEWIASWVGHHLIADNPEIAHHLKTRVMGRDKISMVAYGARKITQAGEVKILAGMDIPYALVIARPVPENHVLEIVKAWSTKKRDHILIVLGALDDDIAYHKAIKQAAGQDVLLAGAIYEAEQVDSLRFNARFYIHGHSVGGTNPSLVEALGAGNAILAHDNPFNRWTTGDAALYFADEEDLSVKIDEFLSQDDQISLLESRARHRFEQAFLWQKILSAYEELLHRFI